MKTTLLLSLALCAGLLAPATRAAMTKLPRSTPEAQGVSTPALLQFIEQADARVNSIHSFMLVRHGQVIAESWWAPYSAGEPHTLFSLSKSFTSTAVGLAVAEGRLSIDDPVLKFFPDLAPASPDKNLQAMRVRDLLTMSTGHHDEQIRDFPYIGAEDPVKVFLSLPVPHKPGTHFMYNTPATFMQSAIVQKLTGQSVLDYLRPRLFEPLGIENPRWEASAQGVSLGGFGLHIRTEDIAKFGLLYLHKGEWQGRQLVPATWVDQATARQVSNGSDPEGDWDQGYGFQFWRCRHGFYRGDGAFGQFCIVLPQYDAVVAITSGTGDMGLVMNLVWDQIVPAFNAGALPENPAAQAKLAEAVSHLRVQGVTAPAMAVSGPAAAAVRHHRYVFEPNPAQVEWLELGETAQAGSEVRLRVRGRDYSVVVGPSEWRKAEPVAAEDGAVAATGAWTAPDTFMLKLAYFRTPFLTTMRLRFEGEQVFLEAQQNVAFGDNRATQVVGRRAK